MHQLNERLATMCFVFLFLFKNVSGSSIFIRGYKCLGEATHIVQHKPEECKNPAQSGLFTDSEGNRAELIFQEQIIDVDAYRCRVNILIHESQCMCRRADCVHRSRPEFQNVKLTATQCRDIVFYKKFIFDFKRREIGKSFEIEVKMSGEIYTLDVIGTEYGFGRCHGKQPKDLWVANEDDGALIHVQIQIYYQPIRLTYNSISNRFYIHKQAEMRENEDGLKDDQGIYYYDKNHTSCNARTTKKVFLRTTSMISEGREVLLLENGQGEYLRVSLENEKMRVCGELVSRSSLDNVFVSKGTDLNFRESHPTIHHRILENEIQISTVQDLTGIVTDNNFRGLEYKMCQLRNFLGIFFREYPIFDYFQGEMDGVQLRPRQEATYYQKCTMISVEVRNNTEKCFVDLPVRLNSGKEMFLERNTHILKENATEVKCTSQLRYGALSLENNKILLCNPPSFGPCNTTINSKKLLASRLVNLTTIRAGRIYQPKDYDSMRTEEKIAIHVNDESGSAKNKDTESPRPNKEQTTSKTLLTEILLWLELQLNIDLFTWSFFYPDDHMNVAAIYIYIVTETVVGWWNENNFKAIDIICLAFYVKVPALYFISKYRTRVKSPEVKEKVTEV